MLWTGRVITTLVVLFLLFDCSIKIAKSAAAVEGTMKLGYPVGTIVPIGLSLLISVILYVIPRTNVLGAILLTGYLGGATATMVRVESPFVGLPVFVGVLVWGGLYFRDYRVRELIPLRRA
jgi:uncharacterized membrane protein YkvI